MCTPARQSGQWPRPQPMKWEGTRGGPWPSPPLLGCSCRVSGSPGLHRLPSLKVLSRSGSVFPPRLLMLLQAPMPPSFRAGPGPKDSSHCASCPTVPARLPCSEALLLPSTLELVCNAHCRAGHSARLQRPFSRGQDAAAIGQHDPPSRGRPG